MSESEVTDLAKERLLALFRAYRPPPPRGLRDDDIDNEVEEDEDCEYEEHDYTIPGDPQNPVKLKLTIRNDEEGEHWLKNIHVRCVRGKKILGTAFGRHINRERIRENFFGQMDQITQEMADLATEVFNRNGILKPEIKRSGTGVWGDELDVGCLLLIESVVITNREARRQGLGRAMINLLIETAVRISKTEVLLERALHPIMAPGVLNEDHDRECREKSEAESQLIYTQSFQSAIAFCRALGFRRIGDSSFFAFSTEPTHISHTIGSKEDFDPPCPEPKC